jgi:hypothetical protein
MGGLNALLGGHPEGVACMCLLRVLLPLLDIRPKSDNQENNKSYYIKQGRPFVYLMMYYALISTSTPEGKSSLLSASTVLEEEV